MKARELEVLIGHYVVEALYARPALSAFRAACTFITDSHWTPQNVWDSVRRELQVAASLLPLIRGDFSRPCSSCVTATDASTTGWGICEPTLDPKVVGEQGRWQERWRLRRLEPEEW
eukprot:15304419-Heterocapsa_arctica.AAC.1